MMFSYTHERHAPGAAWLPATNAQWRRPSVVRNPIRRAYATTLLLLLPLIFLYLSVSGTSLDMELVGLVNALAPFYLISITLGLAYRVLRIYPDSIWTPAIWFPAQSAVFYGFGTLVEVYGNEATIEALSVSPLTIGAEELLRSHLLSTIGIFSVLFGFWLHMVLRARTWDSVRVVGPFTARPTLRPETVAVGFVVAGAFLMYVVVRPAQWGMVDFVLPGFLANISSLIDVGFAIMAFLAARGNRRMQVLFLLLWPIHLLLTPLGFAKTDTIRAILFPALCAYIGHKRLWRLGVWLAGAAVAFVLLQPFVTYGRWVIYKETGTIERVDYLGRFEITKTYIFEERKSDIIGVKQRQGWWARLDFAGVQAFAMNQYEQGRSADTLTKLWLYFIPRIIWPEKPIIENPGRELTELITGNPDLGFTGLSIYGDAYWQFGWMGVGIACALVGLLFAMMTVQSLRVISTRDFILIPAVLIGIQTATQVPNQYLTNIIGVVPIYYAYLFGAKTSANVLKSLNRARIGSPNADTP